MISYRKESKEFEKLLKDWYKNKNIEDKEIILTDIEKNKLIEKCIKYNKKIRNNKINNNN